MGEERELEASSFPTPSCQKKKEIRGEKRVRERNNGKVREQISLLNFG